jgi:hypothetical protein
MTARAENHHDTSKLRGFERRIGETASSLPVKIVLIEPLSDRLLASEPGRGIPSSTMVSPPGPCYPEKCS